MIESLTLSAFTVTLVLSYLLPAAVALLTKSSASAGVKQLVGAVLAVVGSTITTATTADGTAIISRQTLVLAAASFLLSQAAYSGVWKPHGLNDSEKVKPGSGIG